MTEEPAVYNGINGATGRYLPAPTERDMQRERIGAPLNPASLREYRWWVEHYGINDPNRAPIEDVDPKSLASAGWGVILAPDLDPGVEDALQPLLKRRHEEAGPYFKRYVYKKGQGKHDFLAAHRAGPGPADPRQVPYYLLIVGDPRTLPFHVQYELDVQYAVGRLHFQTVEEYANYARGVVEAERSEEARRPKQVTLFGVRNSDDRATQRTSDELIQPLGNILEQDRKEWPLRIVLEERATKSQLGSLLGGPETPALLFTASHGIGFPPDDERQLAEQGALLCKEWPGPKAWTAPIPLSQYFSARDVPDDADVRGLLAFHFACYSAGTPQLSEFDNDPLSDPETIAPYPFVAPLAQRLLGHPRGGALAVLGHVDRAWTSSFSWSDQGQVQVFESTLKRLLDGHPVGSAMEYINQRHAELSVEVSGLYNSLQRGESLSDSHFLRMLQANGDAKNFVVLGDPAVKLIFRAAG